MLTLSTISAYIDSERPPLATGGQAEIGRHKWILELLTKKSDYWARADTGAFVFKTKEGYGVLHALQNKLLEQRVPFTLVHFEGALFGNFLAQYIEPLERLGVAVYQTGLEQTAR